MKLPELCLDPWSLWISCRMLNNLIHTLGTNSRLVMALVVEVLDLMLTPENLSHSRFSISQLCGFNEIESHSLKY